MSAWDWEPFDDIFNHGLFKITKPGPLRAPITNFTLRRDEQLELILQTETARSATSTAVDYPSGTVRINVDTIEFENIAGLTGRAGGVVPYRYVDSSDYTTGTDTRTETTRVSFVEAKLQDAEAKYTIDWLENVSSSPFVWPHSIKTNTTTDETRTLAANDSGLTLSGRDESIGLSNSCVRFHVAGMQVYLCAKWQEKTEGRVKPGCLIYLGTPDEETRERIRNALSFSLGMYLVYLGSATFSANWEIVAFKSISAYSIDRRVFELVVLPPAHFGSRFQHEIVPTALTRMVGSIYSTYDVLKFRSLSWAYWHARCATVHIAPVHFGAAIEALQRRYMEAHADSFRTKIIADRDVWGQLSQVIRDSIDRLQIAEADRKLLLDALGGLNRLPQKQLIEQIVSSIGIQLGTDEWEAWKRRNDAAHGNEIDDGAVLDAVRDMKLLNVLFHRLLLRITNASDNYFDYVTPGFPIRNLKEPVPSTT
jgi:hypothetical protein